MTQFIECPKCGSSKTRVKETRKTFQKEGVTRKRRCEECGHIFSEVSVIINQKPVTHEVILDNKRTRVFLPIDKKEG